MTVYQSLAVWLNDIFTDPDNNFPPNMTVIIDAEIIPGLRQDFPGLELQESALFSNPNDQHKEMLGGQHRHIEFKTWYLVRRFGEWEERLSNEAFLENIRRCIKRTTQRGIMPPQTENRQWRKIEINGGMFPSAKSADNASAVYQIPLKIEYVE